MSQRRVCSVWQKLLCSFGNVCSLCLLGFLHHCYHLVIRTVVLKGCLCSGDRFVLILRAMQNHSIVEVGAPLGSSAQHRIQVWRCPRRRPQHPSGPSTAQLSSAASRFCRGPLGLHWAPGSVLIVPSLQVLMDMAVISEHPQDLPVGVCRQWYTVKQHFHIFTDHH